MPTLPTPIVILFVLFPFVYFGYKYYKNHRK